MSERTVDEKLPNALPDLAQYHRLVELHAAIGDVLTHGYGYTDDDAGRGRGARIDRAMDSLNWNNHTTLRRLHAAQRRVESLVNASSYRSVVDGLMELHWPLPGEHEYTITVTHSHKCVETFKKVFLEDAVDALEAWLTEREKKS